MTTVPKAIANKSTDSVAGLRFLVVDDHKFSRHITIEALKWLNATKITEAADATEAIGLLQGAASFDRAIATVCTSPRASSTFGQMAVEPSGRP